MNVSEIMHAANPVNDDAFPEAWADVEGRAVFERVIATDRNNVPVRPRYRRRLVLVTAAVAVTGGAIAIVGIPGTHHGITPAWSVATSSDGTVTITFSDYRDPTGLQARLRAAGVRAKVRTLATGCAAPRGAYRQFEMSFDSSISSTNFAKLLGIPRPTAVHIGKPTAPAPPRLGQKPSTPHVPAPAKPSAPHIRSILTVHPRYLPSAATLWIGFPANDTSNAGHLLTVTVTGARSGTPACFT
jgi:hypothetical protein